MPSKELRAPTQWETVTNSGEERWTAGIPAHLLLSPSVPALSLSLHLKGTAGIETFPAPSEFETVGTIGNKEPEGK